MNDTTHTPEPAPDRPLVYDNRSLFSDYYLRERLSDHDEWSEDVTPAFEAARRLYLDKREVLDGADEASTEYEFIRPLLQDVLGYHLDVQPPVKHQGRLNRPDYALFTSLQAKADALRHRDDQDAYFNHAAAVADAKFWGRPLDRQVTDERDALTNANPSFQIVNYLVATGVDWGVLTNGKQWRLYYARARSRIDTYFEVDLTRVLESGDTDAFRYFYLFFRAPAFQRDPHTDQSFLEAVHEGSVNYGVELQNRLKDLIFERIFIYLATGFLHWQTDGDLDGAEIDRAALDEIYQGTLRLLYRLLFLLHAEARDLLPVGERDYYGYSLLNLKRRVAADVDADRTFSVRSTDIWNDLEGLFRIIDRGDSALNVPRYNGGLFRRDNPSNEFLNTHRIPDVYLAPALDLLTREYDPETGQHRFIDYKTLNVEQLGSIYEGLLEFNLEIGDQGLEIDNLHSPISILQSPVYLVNDKGERKATGSYYTPHYIVEYIVEHTLGPVLEERAAHFRELMTEIEPRRERLAEIEAKLAADPDRADGVVSRWKNERLGLKRELEPLEREAFEALLGVRVCDPAMGSGHFLVYATDWLAEHLIAVLNEFPDNPVLRRIAGIRQQIVDELTRQGIAVDAERLKDTNLLKRMVMKRCIYGVDLNPMATELAKLSLWLDSFTVGAPLSFLDHHLKVGNSLIGTQVEEVRQALEAEDTGQMHMFGGPFAGLLSATELMRDVAARTDATFEEVEQSAEKYAAFEDAMLPYKRVLDLWVSRHFGNPHADEFLRLYGNDALEAVQDDADAELAAKYEKALARRQRLWLEKRFFHWELEFPEVFIDLKRGAWKEASGFDALVGNPPWLGVRTGEIKADYLDWLRYTFVSAVGQFDLAAVFLEVGVQMLIKDGRIGMVVPKRIATNESYASLRELIAVDWPLISAIDLGVAFEGVNNDALILISGRLRATEMVNLGERKAGVTLESWGVNRSAIEKMPFYIIPVNSAASAVALVDKIANLAIVRLGELVDIQRGAECGMNHPAITQNPGPNAVQLVDHLDVNRFAVKYSGWYVDTSQIASKTLKPLSIYQTVPKLLVRFLSPELIVAKDEVGYASTNLVYHVQCGAETDFLCSVLCSRLLSFWYLTAFQNDEIKFPHVQKSHLESLPIRHIEFTTPSDTRARLLEESEQLYDAYVNHGNESSLLDMVEEQLNQVPERTDVVHDLLAFLTERMIPLQQDRYRVEAALDPFKFLNRGVDFVKFTAAFAEEIKYGERVQPQQTSKVSETFEVSADLATDHHDIDGLRLVALDDGRWELQVQLKLRDPAADWQAWQYEEDGHSIARVWVPAYRFRLDEKKARYYQHAFRVIDEFAAHTSFPGGYTRTTAKKLQLTQVPAYDPDADLTPLVDLSEELAGVRDRIAGTDTLIDQIVYRLYGLTEEEIAVVEGRGRTQLNTDMP